MQNIWRTLRLYIDGVDAFFGLGFGCIAWSAIQYPTLPLLGMFVVSYIVVLAGFNLLMPKVGPTGEKVPVRFVTYRYAERELAIVEGLVRCGMLTFMEGICEFHRRIGTTYLNYRKIGNGDYVERLGKAGLLAAKDGMFGQVAGPFNPELN